MTNETLRELVHHRVLESSCSSTAELFDAVRMEREVTRRHLARVLTDVFGEDPVRSLDEVRNAEEQPLIAPVVQPMGSWFRGRRDKVLIGQLAEVGEAMFLVCSDGRGERWWSRLGGTSGDEVGNALSRLRNVVGVDFVLVPHKALHAHLRGVTLPTGVTIGDFAHFPLAYSPTTSARAALPPEQQHLKNLEAESIRIIRETVAAAKRPGMLFSMGKDSMVMWTLARKAFWPDPPPFPLVVIDTRWKFQEMYRFRHYMAARDDVDLIVHINPDAIERDVNPFDFGSAVHTDITKTQALKQVLDQHAFDYVLGGARRDEEKSRAKERVFSLRDSKHGWDPKNQRPELWNLYNTRLLPGQSMRVFPLSNWTELDIWRYVNAEGIELVPLYFSKVRPFVERDGALIMVDDNRFPLCKGERIHFEPIRFRTLGCYPLTGGVRSSATTVDDIIAELEHTRVSERSSRVIDFDPGASMEQKKKEGYF